MSDNGKPNALRSCPWCCIEDVIIETDEARAWAKCLTCGATGPVACHQLINLGAAKIEGATLERAANLWNGGLPRLDELATIQRARLAKLDEGIK